MGWFFEDKTELVSTGKVIAEERVTGQGLSELGKFVGIIVLGWVLATAGGDSAPPADVPPTVSQESPAPTPTPR